MKKLTILFVILTALLIYLFFNLGNFLDVTTKPSKTNLIVSLGGGTNNLRQKKTVELYKNGFLENKYIIFTGVKKINENIYDNFDKSIYLLSNDKVKNTMEEVLYIKKFIRENNLSSVIFVTDAAHSRRVKFFWNNFGEKLNHVSFSVVATEFPSWNSSKYYEDNLSIKYAFSEITKLAYNFILYGLFENLGFKEEFESTYKKEIKELKKEFNIKLN